jgi:hypothetical protein
MRACRLTVNWLRYEVDRFGAVRHVDDFGAYVDSPATGTTAGTPLMAEQAAPILAEVKRRRANKNRKARDQAMRDMGMVKVRGNLGGTFWE